MLKPVEAAPTAELDPRWRAIEARDRSADGSFVFSVRTTGIYCRPSCPARHAKPENVAFHPTCEDAERAGFRPCKRCRPNEASAYEVRAAMVARACRFIEQAEESPRLADLARREGVSPFHFHRQFKAETGLTPKAYANAERAKRVRSELARTDRSVTSAIYGAGFNSNGRFYETAKGMLGMRPTDYKAGGAGTEIRFAFGQSSLGAVLAAASEKGVCFIALGDRQALQRDLEKRFPNAVLIAGDASFEQTVAKVVALVERPEAGLDLPLDIRGTAFQQLVWQALRDIPLGETASYSDVARRIGAPRSVRAVAAACGANKLAVVIPCHRAVGVDGKLTGYRWGVERKRALLKKEGAA